MVSRVPPAFQGHHRDQYVQVADDLHPGIHGYYSTQQLLPPFMLKRALEQSFRE